LLSAVEQTRLQVSKRTEAKKKSLFGQFLTPAKTAEFMAKIFPQPINGICTLLDAGAGIGSLSSAFIERCVSGNLNFKEIRLTAFELDDIIHVELNRSLVRYMNKTTLSFEIVGGDFIETAVNRIQFGQDGFTHAILNPPYKKIGSNSRYRLLLRQVGIETVNLYSAFVALALLLMVPGGQVVAIIPRSFCNGPYYRPFRDFVLKHAAIQYIHLFESRSKAFKDDEVLQENIIIRLERGGRQGTVTVSTSTDDSFTDFASYEHPFNSIVFPDDLERFIHIPTSLEKNTIELSPAIRYSLADLGVNVSTGPVVDFRLKKYLCNTPESGAVPLFYPVHFSSGGIEWPKVGSKKPNAIHHNVETEKWLYPNGFYCVVRRFSSKEEKRRIVASVVDPTAFKDVTMLGFENHLNLFHENKRGLPEGLARGLCVFLNTTAFDENFRRFSGHTQVNAADLKMMKYPSRNVLIAIGEWAIKSGKLTQVMIDEKLRTLNE
jgi:tRNA1(Val) A37 N6-methylase TrmN6